MSISPNVPSPQESYHYEGGGTPRWISILFAVVIAGVGAMAYAGYSAQSHLQQEVTKGVERLSTQGVRDREGAAVDLGPRRRRCECADVGRVVSGRRSRRPSDRAAGQCRVFRQFQAGAHAGARPASGDQ